MKDNNINLNNVSDIKFREKNDFGLIVDMIRLAPNRVVDFYTLAYLAGLDYTENCYHCPFAKSDRISDITLGDSWSATPEKQKSGISLILCQTQKGIDLVAQSKLDLEKVNPQLAKKTNHQLVSPSIPHLKRNYFIDALIRGKKFSTAFIIAMPKDAAKQIIKWILTIIHIL